MEQEKRDIRGSTRPQAGLSHLGDNPMPKIPRSGFLPFLKDDLANGYVKVMAPKIGQVYAKLQTISGSRRVELLGWGLQPSAAYQLECYSNEDQQKLLNTLS